MIPVHYPLRPSDGASVPAVFGVLGITSPLPVDPPAGVLGPSSHSVLGSDAPYHPPRSRGCICYHSRSTTINERRPSQNPHQTLYTPPGGPIFPEAGITSGGAQ